MSARRKKKAVAVEVQEVAPVVEPAPVVEEVPVPAEPVPVEVAEEPTIPPPPPKDHRGDKTPAYVSWMFKYKPDEAKRLYTGRKYVLE